jgi:hypothetical protein
MPHTMTFLAATRGLDAALRRRAEEFSENLVRARISMTLLAGGTPTRSQRVVPGCFRTASTRLS